MLIIFIIWLSCGLIIATDVFVTIILSKYAAPVEALSVNAIIAYCTIVMVVLANVYGYYSHTRKG